VGKRYLSTVYDSGDRIDCSNCANLTLRVTAKDGKHFLEEIPKVSCPTCERVMEIPGDLRAGETMECCGEKYVLTYEFGAYALITQGDS
jgi:hypothetical protein